MVGCLTPPFLTLPFSALFLFLFPCFPCGWSEFWLFLVCFMSSLLFHLSAGFNQALPCRHICSSLIGICLVDWPFPPCPSPSFDRVPPPLPRFSILLPLPRRSLSSPFFAVMNAIFLFTFSFSWHSFRVYPHALLCLRLSVTSSTSLSASSRFASYSLSSPSSFSSVSSSSLSSLSTIYVFTASQFSSLPSSFSFASSSSASSSSSSSELEELLIALQKEQALLFPSSQCPQKTSPSSLARRSSDHDHEWSSPECIKSNQRSRCLHHCTHWVCRHWASAVTFFLFVLCWCCCSQRMVVERDLKKWKSNTIQHYKSAKPLNEKQEKERKAKDREKGAKAERK